MRMERELQSHLGSEYSEGLLGGERILLQMHRTNYRFEILLIASCARESLTWFSDAPSYVSPPPDYSE